MSCIQSKITKHAKKEETRTHQEEKRQSTENAPEVKKRLELSDRDIYKFKKLSRDMGDFKKKTPFNL